MLGYFISFYFQDFLVSSTLILDAKYGRNMNFRKERVKLVDAIILFKNPFINTLLFK